MRFSGQGAVRHRGRPAGRMGGENLTPWGFRRLTDAALSATLLRMKDTISTAELVVASGASARDIDNWLVRLPLTTDYGPMGRGRARSFKPDNALEIALIAALVKARISAGDAASRMGSFFEQWDSSEPEDSEWSIFFWGDAELDVISCDKPPFKMKEVMQALLRLTEEEGTTFTILNTGKIIRRVDSLFKKKQPRKVQAEPRGKAA
jgi:hypothetical protein